MCTSTLLLPVCSPKSRCWTPRSQRIGCWGASFRLKTIGPFFSSLMWQVSLSVCLHRISLFPVSSAERAQRGEALELTVAEREHAAEHLGVVLAEQRSEPAHVGPGAGEAN